MISIIIPVLHEDLRIGLLLDHLLRANVDQPLEVIVVDGDSGSSKLNLEQYNWVTWLTSSKGRAIQMNAGARAASGDILYFVHADTLPPLTFYADIMAAISKGYVIGSFKFRLVPESFFTNINSFVSGFYTRFSGGGDQSLFIKREVFFKEEGFNETYCIMEDFEFVRRIRSKYNFHIIQNEILVSARKYKANSYWKVSIANYKAFKMYENGVDPEIIRDNYYGWIKKGE